MAITKALTKTTTVIVPVEQKNSTIFYIRIRLGLLLQ